MIAVADQRPARAIQHQMELRDDPTPLPLAGVNAACRDLRLPARGHLENPGVIDLIDDYAALIAFNIAVELSGRRELRILTRSVEHYKTTLGSRPPNLSWAQIVKLIVPHDKPALTAVEAARALNCKTVMPLLERRLLKTVPGTDWQRGPGGSASITRESFVAFLEKRRIA
jgi:hypothetical protein